MKQSTQTYFVEMTDTFSGDANYSWVRRFLVQSVSMRGAISKVTRETGYHARVDYDCGDMARYNAVGACICYFVSDSTGRESEMFSGIVTL